MVEERMSDMGESIRKVVRSEGSKKRRDGRSRSGNRMSKSEFVQTIAEDAGISKKQANAAIQSMNQLLADQLKRSGEAVIPKMVKLNVVTKPATPEREGINPFTKEPTVFKAKPERRVVKARVLKGLKDSVQGAGTRTGART